jgi:hypothetical protein
MKKILFALPFVFALTACGGGGGGSPSPTQDKNVPDQSEPKIEPVNVLENEIKSLPVSNASSLIYTVKSDNGSKSNTSTNSSSDLPHWLSIVFESGSVVFKVSEVDRPYSITIEFRDKNTNEIDFEVSLFVDNSSGKELVSQVERAISQSDKLLSLENDRKLYFYIVDLLYLSDSSVTYSDKQSYLKEFDVEEFSTFQAFSDSISELDLALNDYNKGDITDIALKNYLEDFENNLLEHGRMASGMIEFLQSDINNTGVVTLPNTDVNYIEKKGFYSRFIGNSEYGQWVNENWVYNPDFDFLSKIVNVDIAGTCSI